ncbi:hypothetical protein MTO96_014471 [Rhipicephalus appendiculatus]
MPSTAAVVQAGTTKDATRRRCAPVAAKRAAALKTVLESPWLEAALRSTKAARQKLLVTDRAYSVLKPAIGVTVVVLVGSIATIVLTPYRTLGAFLFVVSVIFESISLAIFLSTCSERTRAFLARLFGLKPCDDDAFATGRITAKRPKTSPLRVTVIDMPVDQGSIRRAAVPHAKCGRNCQACSNDLHGP